MRNPGWHAHPEIPPPLTPPLPAVCRLPARPTLGQRAAALHQASRIDLLSRREAERRVSLRLGQLRQTERVITGAYPCGGADCMLAFQSRRGQAQHWGSSPCQEPLNRPGPDVVAVAIGDRMIALPPEHAEAAVAAEMGEIGTQTAEEQRQVAERFIAAAQVFSADITDGEVAGGAGGVAEAAQSLSRLMALVSDRTHVGAARRNGRVLAAFVSALADSATEVGLEATDGVLITAVRARLGNDWKRLQALLAATGDALNGARAKLRGTKRTVSERIDAAPESGGYSSGSGSGSGSGCESESMLEEGSQSDVPPAKRSKADHDVEAARRDGVSAIIGAATAVGGGGGGGDGSSADGGAVVGDPSQ